MKQLILIFLSYVMMSHTCLSQEPNMLVEISSDTILMGNYIQLRYTIDNEQGDFEMPELEGLMIVSGPNVSSSMSVVNGEVSQQSSYSLYLKPIDIGTQSIGPAYIATERGTLESQPISIIVVDNPAGHQQNTNTLKVIEEVILDKDSDAKRKKVKRFKI